MHHGRPASIVKAFLTIVLVSGLIQCGSPIQPEGLAESGGGTGPAIVFDPLIRPIPDIPFPMDIATVLDETSPTGRRLNFPVNSSTIIERLTRERLNTLDGFGTYSPIWVKLDAPLNLTTVNDTSVMLIKLTGPDAGHMVPLDLGKGFFPTMFRPDHWWPHDTMANVTNLLYSDANRYDLDGDTTSEFIDFYEFETNTLIIRPIVAMDEASRYAVVLLKDLKGLDGQPVRSPFKYINHTMQTNDLRPLVDLLAQKGIDLDRVAFCWSFTTQSITPQWEDIINGLFHATGPLGYLASAFPPVLEPANLNIAMDGDGNFYTLRSDWIGPVLEKIDPFIGSFDLKSFVDFRYVDYFVFGTYKSPTFFGSLAFGDPQKVDEITFDPARLAGTVPANSLNVTWIMTVPRDEDTGLDICKPSVHPHGCKDYEEPGAAGPDLKYGVADNDDNGDTFKDDIGEYLALGSDDVADPDGDNYNPNDPTCNIDPANPCTPPSAFHCAQGNKRLDYDCGVDGVPGTSGDDDDNGILNDISEFGWPGSDDGPTEDANHNGRLDTPPFPVALYGHGHGLAAFESIGFVSAIPRHGIAMIAIDSFGNGPIHELATLEQLVRQTLGNSIHDVCYAASPTPACKLILDLVDEMDIGINVEGRSIEDIVDEVFNIGLFYVFAKLGRAYDTDGDTIPDSGAVDFTANIFQTRDCLRQTAIDYMQLARIVDNFGTPSSWDFNGDTVPDVNGDLNSDGQYDMGGPTDINTRGHFYLGSSLGGINGDISMAVNPRITVGAPVSGAAGLVDVIYRSHEQSATKPIIPHADGIIVVGDYDGTPGRATLTFNNDPKSKTVGYLYMPDFGRVQVTNLTNGETELVTGKCDPPTVTNCPLGTAVNFSIGIPSDVGDLIQISSLDDNSGMIKSVAVVSAEYHGFGAHRNTPEFRKFLALGQIIIEPSDPANLAKHYFTNDRGSPFPGVPQKSVLIISTVGDQNVPISTGNAIASAAGLWPLDTAKKMIDNGLNLGYLPEEGYNSPIYDPEDVDDDGLECGFSVCNTPDNLAPVPVVHEPGTNKVSAYRIHYPSDSGHHAFALPGQINNGIDWGVYMLNQIGYFFASDGTCVIDDPWELHAAPHIRPGGNRILDSGSPPGTPMGDDKLHTIRVLTTLGTNPCDYPFEEIQVITTGPNGTLDTSRVGDDVEINFNNMYRGP